MDTRQQQLSEKNKSDMGVTILDSKPLNKSMQEKERKGISDVGSSCADSSKLDDLSVQINDQILDSENKTPQLKVETSSI